MKHHDIHPVGVGDNRALTPGRLADRLAEDRAADAQDRKAKREARRWESGNTEVLQVEEGCVTLTEHARKKTKVFVQIGGREPFQLTEDQAYDLADALDEFITEQEERLGWGSQRRGSDA